MSENERQAGSLSVDLMIMHVCLIISKLPFGSIFDGESLKFNSGRIEQIEEGEADQEERGRLT